ncbi:MAG: amidase [Rhodobiaceae bacterium]|jgi:amidase|nr:amidase [Rhodobiaceae bacterium]MBT6222643.1 amidase [Rhodobiaceae bacterium]
MQLNEYKSYDATDLAKIVKNKDIHPKELLDLAISSIESEDKTISAVVIKAYDAANKTIENGIPNGPFAGVPFLLKDLNVSYKGLPTTLSSKLFQSNIAKHDSGLVKQYKDAGLIILGLTKTPELALSLTTEPVLNGPTRNPLNIEYSPGGSSGGSAAAIIAGYVPMAHGTDGGGSIRVPASLCGLFGLKPSRGRISYYPDLGEGLGGMATSHCLSKSVRDSATLLDISSNILPGDPYVAPKNNDKFSKAAETDPKKLKIAICTTDFEGNKINNESVLNTLKTGKLCEDLGHIVEEAYPDLSDLPILKAWKILPGINLLNNLTKRSEFLGVKIKDTDVEPLHWSWMEEAKQYTAIDYLNAMNTMHLIGRRIGDFLQGYDLILTPTLAKPDLKLGKIKTDHTDVDKQLNYLFKEFSPYTAVFNQSGGAAMSLPLWTSSKGLPIGMHFGGKLGDEEKLIQLAGQFERSYSWNMT